jgi:hypothetical protein
MPTDTDPEILCLGCGNQHNADPLWLFHDFESHHPDVRLEGDLELATFRSKVVKCRAGEGYRMAHAALDIGEPILFKAVVLKDVLEHVAPNRLLDVMQFCWNCLRPEGILRIQVPQWGSYNALVDPTHYRGFHLDSFDIFDPTTRLGRKNKFYGLKPWKLTQKESVKGSDVNLQFVLQKIA